MTAGNPDGGPPPDDFSCQAFVEAVTHYLEGAMPPGLTARLEAHRAECAGCTSVLEQFRRVIDLAGRLGEDDVEAVDAARRARLLTIFREVARPARPR